jgi:hypothetical protein
MLILDESQVNYCQVTGKLAGQNKQASGLIYQSNVFIKVKSYPEGDLDSAIRDCREQYLDNKDLEIPTLIIKEKTAVTLWIEDNRFQPIKSTEIANTQTTQAKTSNLNLRQLAEEMKREKGLNIKTRRYKLKLYHHCFVGSEAVDWLVEKLKISRPAAINIGQKLIDKKIIHHVSDEHSFKDELLYYRFYEDEGKSIWTDKII